VPQLPRFPRESPQAHPHHERAGEAQSQEIKRRSRVVRIFPNERSCLRLLTALAVEQSEEWITGRRYLDMEELERHCLEEERGVEGVIAHGTMS
jgi:transposase-like protein